MIEIRFREKLIQSEDTFLHYLEQPESPEVLQKLAMYSVLYSEALMDEKQASYIELKKRVDQLRQNAQVLLNCRVRLVFEYSLGGPILGAIDETITSIEKFAAADVS